MYCSGCGKTLEPGQAVCPQCGRPAAPPVPPIPGLQFQLENYRSKIRALAVVWFVYAGISLLLGFAALTFARQFFMGGFGPWMHGPMPPAWIFPAFIQFAWIALVVRAGLAVAAGWGLLEQAPWGRVVAIVAAILSLLKFPFGTAMGIWTLVMLLGYRNATLYEQL
jgi:hypothetical protein